MTDGSRKKGDVVYGLGPGFLKFVARAPILKATIAPLWRAATRDNDAFSLAIADGPEASEPSRLPRRV